MWQKLIFESFFCHCQAPPPTVLQALVAAVAAPLDAAVAAMDMVTSPKASGPMVFTAFMFSAVALGAALVSPTAMDVSPAPGTMITSGIGVRVVPVASWNAFAFFFTTWCLYLRVLCVGLRRRATRLARMGRTVTR